MRSLNRCKLKNAMRCVPAQKIKMKKKILIGSEAKNIFDDKLRRKNRIVEVYLVIA